MKKPFILICLVVLGLNCAAQNKKVMEFYLHGEQQLVVNMSGIKSVVWVARDTAPAEPQPQAIDLGLKNMVIISSGENQQPALPLSTSQPTDGMTAIPNASQNTAQTQPMAL